MATRRISGLVIARVAGAVALLVVGGIHLEQYTVGNFSVVPTIGTLFFVNFVAATVLGLWLLVPVRGGYRPVRLAVDCAVSVAAIGVAGGAMIALLISEARPLFGFMEQGYRIEIVIALVSEAAVIVLLGAFLALAGASPRTAERGRRPWTRGSVGLSEGRSPHRNSPCGHQCAPFGALCVRSGTERRGRLSHLCGCRRTRR